MYGEDTRFRMLVELLYCVFEQLELADEMRTLNACSRVCKLWLPIARRYIFTELRIHAPSQHRPSLRPGWIEWYGYQRPECIDLSLVTRLVITNPHDFPLTLNRLVPILQSLPILSSLDILGGTIHGFFSHPQFVPHIPTLTVLSISGVTAERPEDLLDLIRSFHTVKSIGIVEDNVNFTTADPSNPYVVPAWEQFSLPVGFAPSSLSVYSLRRSNAAYFDLLTRLGAAPSLRRISLSWWDFEDVLDTVSSFLSNARFLQTLTFDFYTHWDHTLEATPSYSGIVESCAQVQRVLTPALSLLRSLQTFSLTPIDAPPHSTEWMLCFALLMALPAHLPHLELHLHGENAHFDLVSFRNCLGRLHGLRTVRVFFDEAGMEARPTIIAFEGFSARFHEVLRDVASRGVALDVLWEFRP